METIDIKRVQKRLLEMAVAIRDILESNSIPYQIAFGTLLGAIRHKGFIPWDDDFDFFLFDDTYEEAKVLLRKGLPADMFLEDENSEPNYFHAWAHVKDLLSVCECEKFPHDSKYKHKGISVDLYILKKIKTVDFANFRFQSAMQYIDKRKELGFITDIDYSNRKELYKLRMQNDLINSDAPCVFAYPFDIGYQFIEDVLPLKKYIFNGYEFSGPSNPDNILRMRYANYMELPPIKDRVPHFSKVDFKNDNSI